METKALITKLLDKSFEVAIGIENQICHLIDK